MPEDIRQAALDAFKESERHLSRLLKLPLHEKYVLSETESIEAGVQFDTGESEFETQMRDYLRTKRALVVLDKIVQDGLTKVLPENPKYITVDEAVDLLNYGRDCCTYTDEGFDPIKQFVDKHGIEIYGKMVEQIKRTTQDFGAREQELNALNGKIITPQRVGIASGRVA